MVFQLAWLKKVYHFEQKEFDHSVVKSIKGLYEDINENAYYLSNLNELIENPETHLYLAQVNLPVNVDTLVSYLQFELEDFGIFTDCHLGIYDAKLNKYINTDVLTSAGTKEKSRANLPMVVRKFDYLALYFPKRRQYILSQMNFWIFSSAILIIVLILFSASLYYFYRQKFLNEIQNDFIHNFTHEFKTPVSVISLAADVLKSENITEKPGKLATYAGIVENQAHYLQEQIEKLLQFAYTESGRMHLKKETIDMHEIIREAVNNLILVISEKNPEITFQLNATDHVIKADRGYMLITITNLLDNAIKYSRKPVIVISTKNTENKLQVYVKDNGIGIEKKQVKKIFRKFYRVRTGDTYVSKGFGLGLSFVKTILKAHNGNIKIETESGQGSTFIIELPIL
jgi:two-component system phosphate regulon sensor histidine kinase PhoR